MGRHPNPERRRRGEADVLEDRCVINVIRLEINVIVIVTLEYLILWRALRADEHVVREPDVHIVRQEFSELIEVRFQNELI